MYLCIHVPTYACALQSFLVACQHTSRSSRSMKKVGGFHQYHTVPTTHSDTVDYFRSSNNTQSPPGNHLRRHPDIRTRSSQHCFYDYLPPNHTPLQTVPYRTVHTSLSIPCIHTQTYPNKHTRLYIKTPSHYRQTGRHTGIQAHIQEYPCLLRYTVLLLPSASPNPTQNVQYTVRKQSQATTLPQCWQPVRICVCVCIYVSQFVCQ